METGRDGEWRFNALTCGHGRGRGCGRGRGTIVPVPQTRRHMIRESWADTQDIDATPQAAEEKSTNPSSTHIVETSCCGWEIQFSPS